MGGIGTGVSGTGVSVVRVSIVDKTYLVFGTGVDRGGEPYGEVPQIEKTATRTNSCQRRPSDGLQTERPKSVRLAIVAGNINPVR